MMSHIIGTTNTFFMLVMTCCISLQETLTEHYGMFRDVRPGPSHLVKVSQPAPGPHLLHQKVPEFSFCLQVGLKHLEPARGPDTKGSNPTEEKRSGGDLHLLQRSGRCLMENKSSGLVNKIKRKES